MADEEAIIKQAMSLIGRRSSERKKRASAENGKRGGRPRGTPQSEETRAKIRAARLARETGTVQPAEGTAKPDTSGAATDGGAAGPVAGA